MKVVLGQDQRVIDWVAERVRRFPRRLIAATAIGFERPNGELGCGVVYQNFCRDLDGKPNEVEQTLAFDNNAGLTGPGMLRVAFGYPFGQLGVRRLTTYVASDNEKSLNVVRRLGYVHEGTLRDAVHPGIDFLIYGMKRDECRFWREHGR